jgi:hypothetical protein
MRALSEYAVRIHISFFDSHSLQPFDGKSVSLRSSLAVPN